MSFIIFKINSSQTHSTKKIILQILKILYYRIKIKKEEAILLMLYQIIIMKMYGAIEEEIMWLEETGNQMEIENWSVNSINLWEMSFSIQNKWMSSWLPQISICGNWGENCLLALGCVSQRWLRMSRSTKEVHTLEILPRTSLLTSECHGRWQGIRKEDLSSMKAMRMLQWKPKLLWTIDWMLLHVLENNFKTEKMVEPWKLLNSSLKLFHLTVQI